MDRVAGSQPRASAPNLLGKHVLVVEDEYLLAEDIAHDLEAAGAHVIGPFASLSEGLALVAGGALPDAAVLDINLRGEMVFSLAEALRERGVPFVFSTGYERWSIPEAYRDVHLCGKPVGPEAIVRALFGS